MRKLKVHVLFEHGSDHQPFGASQIRLLRPLAHPAIGDHLEMTAGLDYDGQPVDAVIVDRLWRPDVSRALIERLAADVRRAGARLIYSIDDNLLDLAAEKKDWQPSDEQLWALDFILRQADGVMVATPALQERLAEYNPNIVVVPNALDERLINPARDSRDTTPTARFRGVEQIKSLLRRILRGASAAAPTPAPRIIVGYMGTHTHDDDLLMILPSLLEVWQRHRDQVEFQIVGVLAYQETLAKLGPLPIRFVTPPPGGWEYLRFLPWFTAQTRWDIAIAPLMDTPFSRCKSDIKFLDYSAIGAAGIYSRVPAYESSVRHLETGWLAESDVNAWSEALERLISDDLLRLRLANNATRYLYSDRILAHSAIRWLEAIEHLLA